MMNLVEIGKRMKALREESNLTQTKLAEYLSLDQSMIAKMEKGERKLTADVVDKLSRLFCCPVEFLLSGEASENKCTISFRTNALTADDLKALAAINKIVLNQFEMNQMLEGM